MCRLTEIRGKDSGVARTMNGRLRHPQTLTVGLIRPVCSGTLHRQCTEKHHPNIVSMHLRASKWIAALYGESSLAPVTRVQISK